VKRQAPRLAIAAMILFLFFNFLTLQNRRHTVVIAALTAEQWISAEMAKLDPDVSRFDYEPELIAANGNASMSALTLRDLAIPLSWSVDDDIVRRFVPQSSVTVRQHNAFERAWADYVRLHNRITAGALPPRFVHVAFPPEAGMHARMKVITSATLLALATRRAIVISWVPTPRSSGMLHSPLIELFRSPGFDWWYTQAKYAATRFWRLTDVIGFGQEDADSMTYEPEMLVCADLCALNASWLEMHWKYDAFAGGVFHNPYLRPRLERLLAHDDLYGPIARKLFRPHKRLWKRIMHARRRMHDASITLVGVELSKPVETRPLLKCISSRGLQPSVRRPNGRRATARLLSLQVGEKITPTFVMRACAHADTANKVVCGGSNAIVATNSCRSVWGQQYIFL
jgi:hypothetical protein